MIRILYLFVAMISALQSLAADGSELIRPNPQKNPLRLTVGFIHVNRQELHAGLTAQISNLKRSRSLIDRLAGIQSGSLTLRDALAADAIINAVLQPDRSHAFLNNLRNETDRAALKEASAFLRTDGPSKERLNRVRQNLADIVAMHTELKGVTPSHVGEIFHVFYDQVKPTPAVMTDLRVGDFVEHPNHGVGLVREADVQGDQPSVTVDFSGTEVEAEGHNSHSPSRTYTLTKPQSAELFRLTPAEAASRQEKRRASIRELRDNMEFFRFPEFLYLSRIGFLEQITTGGPLSPWHQYVSDQFKLLAQSRQNMRDKTPDGLRYFERAFIDYAMGSRVIYGRSARVDFSEADYKDFVAESFDPATGRIRRTIVSKATTAAIRALADKPRHIFAKYLSGNSICAIADKDLPGIVGYLERFSQTLGLSKRMSDARFGGHVQATKYSRPQMIEEAAVLAAIRNLWEQGYWPEPHSFGNLDEAIDRLYQKPLRANWSAVLNRAGIPGGLVATLLFPRPIRLYADAIEWLQSVEGPNVDAAHIMENYYSALAVARTFGGWGIAMKLTGKEFVPLPLSPLPSEVQALVGEIPAERLAHLMAPIRPFAAVVSAENLTRRPLPRETKSIRLPPIMRF